MGAWFAKIKEAFPSVHISCAYRDAASQNAAFKEGKSKLTYPNSPHNQINTQGQPASRALDLFNLSIEGLATFPPAFYAAIANYCERESNGAKIKWGGTFKILGDSNHFQLV